MNKKNILTKQQIFNAKIVKLTLDFHAVAKEVQKKVKDNGEEISFQEAIERTYNLIVVSSFHNDK